MDKQQAITDVTNWIVDFVEKPNPMLAGWPPCPYARRARLDNTVDIRVGYVPYTDLVRLSYKGLGDKSVLIFIYDAAAVDRQSFFEDIRDANEEHLLNCDIIALEDHPDAPEFVNGVCMNQGQYALAICQRLSELNDRARDLAKKDFYHGWSEQYLQDLFQYRQDPRS